MCGIVGYIGEKKAVPILLEGLKRLEYRGYDSAGLAVIDQGRMVIHRAVGKIKELENQVWGTSLTGTIGLGHTRWATHGRPTEENAHPHTDCSGDLVVIHNGIIENYLALKEKLLAEGHLFRSETDTEVIAHLIEKYLRDDRDIEVAVRRALNDVTGAYAIGVLWAGDPDRIVGAKCQSPLVVGLGEGDFFFASDIPAILNHTRNVLFLDDGEIVVLTRDGVHLTTLAGRAGPAAGGEGPVEPHPGGAGRLQALHAEGDLRAAARRAGHDPRPLLRGVGADLPGGDGGAGRGAAGDPESRR